MLISLRSKSTDLSGPVTCAGMANDIICKNVESLAIETRSRRGAFFYGKTISLSKKKKPFKIRVELSNIQGEKTTLYRV